MGEGGQSPSLCLKNTGEGESRMTRSSKLRKQNKMVTFRETWPLHAMLLIPILTIFIFGTIPLLGGIAISFENFKVTKGIFGSKFVGLKNYAYIFKMPDTAELIRNTVVIAVGKNLLTQLIALFFAVVLNELRSVRFRRITQTIVYLPHFLSWVILAGIVRSMLSTDGTVNQFLMQIGIISEPIWFLGSNDLFQGTIILSSVWKEFGYSAIIFIAALTSIDPTLYEAAAIDGCGRLRRIFAITLPCISTTVIMIATLQIGGILDAGFDQIFNLYSPVVYETGDVISTYVYRMGLINRQYSISTAIGLMQSVICFGLTMLAKYLAERFANYSIF